MQAHRHSQAEIIIEHIHEHPLILIKKVNFFSCHRARIFKPKALKKKKKIININKSIRLSALEDPCFFMPLLFPCEQIKPIKAQISRCLHPICTCLYNQSARKSKYLNEWVQNDLLNKTEIKKMLYFLGKQYNNMLF